MHASDTHIHAAITQVAADWFAAHQAGPLSDADRAEFLAWLKASPLHIEEYLGVAALEHPLIAASDDPSLSVQDLVAMAQSDPADAVVDLARPSMRYESAQLPAPRLFWRRAAFAACTGVLGLCTLWVVRQGHPSSNAKTYRTGHGEQGVWPLADGSTLHLNTDTRVTVQFSPAERLLDVDHGQIAVEVAHESRRPFRVHAGLADTVALGTDFDVQRKVDSIVITVATGQVAVSVGPSTQPRAARSELANGLRVGAGRQVRVTAGIASAVESVDLKETTAWLERKIVFEQRPLGTVAEEFNRYNDRTFTIDDPALRQLAISGDFSATDPESFATFLESLDGVRVQRLPSGFKVSRST